MRYVRVRVNTNNSSLLIMRLKKVQANIKNIKYKNDYVQMDIEVESLNRVRKYLCFYEFKIISALGIDKVKEEARKNMLFIISVIFGVLVFLVLSRVIVKVNIIHESAEIRELLESELRERGVTNMTFRKSYSEYEEIIEDIKNSFKDKIEWLEIDVKGMVIDVRVEERILNENNKDYRYCQIVADKSGIVKEILTKRGVAEVKLLDFVKKGDILINGEIKLNEEVKENVCAEGKVVAEVWYNVGVKIPLDKEEIKPTGKMRFNLMVKKGVSEYVILKSRVKEKEVKNIKLFKIFGFEVYIQKEIEIEKNIRKISEEEALEEAFSLVSEKLLARKEKIVAITDKKVLKKSLNNGNLDIDMFVVVLEDIGVKKYYEEGKE